MSLFDVAQVEFERAGHDASDDRPRLLLDGVRVDPAGQDALTGTAASICSVNDKTLAPMLARLDVRTLSIQEVRATSIDGVQRLGRLRYLAINWATRLSDLAPLTALSKLEVLSLIDTPKAGDLTPLTDLSQLRALEFSGGMWNKNRAQTLEPLSGLRWLEELRMTNLAVQSGGLRPLSALTALKSLTLTNQFETSDYAYLSVHLPRAECARFAPYETMSHNIGGKNIMVTGKRKPFLNSRDPKDAARLQKYVAAWAVECERARADLH